jgi:hypothetical protein
LRRSVADTNCDGHAGCKRYAYRNGNGNTYTNGDGYRYVYPNPNAYAESYANATTCADTKDATNAAAKAIVGNINS